jgi:histidyl-tRNA synthetase
VLILPMTEDLSAAIALATTLRAAGIRAQLHCEEKKFKQKMSYADKQGIPYVIFLGEDEINAGVVACKDMASGEQKKFKQKMSYADKLGVPFAVLLGEDEIAEGMCSVKDMRTGQQVKLTVEDAAAYIRTTLAATDGPVILEK